jgi:hypothetical protein
VVVAFMVYTFCYTAMTTKHSRSLLKKCDNALKPHEHVMLVFLIFGRINDFPTIPAIL